MDGDLGAGDAAAPSGLNIGRIAAEADLGRTRVAGGRATGCRPVDAQLLVELVRGFALDGKIGIASRRDYGGGSWAARRYGHGKAEEEGHITRYGMHSAD